MTFSISPRECWYSPLKIRLSCSKREPFRVLLPLLRQVVPLSDGNCRLTIPVGKGRCARDALPHAFQIGVFKFGFTISTAIKHIYKESANIIEGCNVACDTNDCLNFQETVPVITIESLVKRARPCYTRFFLTPGICSLIKPTDMVKLMQFSPKSTQTCYNKEFHLIDILSLVLHAYCWVGWLVFVSKISNQIY